MESVILNLLKDQKLTLSSSEALTGGILATRMSALDSKLDLYKGSIVRPHDEKNLKIPGPNRAAAAAQSARAYFSTDIGIAALLPEENEDYAPGTVFIAISRWSIIHSKNLVILK